MLEHIAFYDEIIRLVNKNVKTLKAYPKFLNHHEDADIIESFNVCLYFELIQSDLVVGLKYLDISQTINNKIEANYFARVVALNSFEALNSVNKLIGKNVQNHFIKINELELVSEINSIGRQLNILKKSCFKELEEIRNNVIAHKKSDAIMQTKIMLSIDNKRIYEIGRKLFDLGMELVDKYMIYFSKP